jgi:hypothetical protein
MYVKCTVPILLYTSRKAVNKAKNYSFQEAKLEKKMLILLPRVVFEAKFLCPSEFPLSFLTS